MLLEDFLSHIETQYTSQLPFVAYSMPNTIALKAVIQNNVEIHKVNNFTENGFIFSPFDSENETIIFPFDLCETITSEYIASSEKSANEIHKSNSDNFYQEHSQLVQKGIDSIKSDQLKKVVLSRTEVVSMPVDNPIHTFKSLLNRYSTAFVYIWYHPKVGLWLGATPETLLHVEGQRFKTMALAGTQLYVDSIEVDWDTKNIEEQLIVTAFIEKELMPLTEHITAMPAQTIKAGQLLHLQSEISGVLKPGHLKDVIFSLHPTPAVCGLPKAEAKAFILSHENYNREFYTGFLGELNVKNVKTRNTNRRNVENNAYASVKTVSQLFVNLRCMQIKNQQALIYVGGGITKDSNPKKEWEETINKTQTMMSVLI